MLSVNKSFFDRFLAMFYLVYQTQVLKTNVKSNNKKQTFFQDNAHNPLDCIDRQKKQHNLDNRNMEENHSFSEHKSSSCP